MHGRTIQVKQLAAVPTQPAIPVDACGVVTVDDDDDDVQALEVPDSPCSSSSTATLNDTLPKGYKMGDKIVLKPARQGTKYASSFCTLFFLFFLSGLWTYYSFIKSLVMG